jgi:UDP-glucose 4-epimerase
MKPRLDEVEVNFRRQVGQGDQLMQKVLVTGGTGFIGKHLVTALARSGVKCLVTTRSDLESADPNIKYIKCNLAASDCISILKPHMPEVDVIIHIAALIPRNAVQQEDIGSYIANNVLTTGHLLDAIIQSEKEGQNAIASLVFTSTIDVYGVPERLPVQETEPTKPSTAYAIAKLSAEHLLRWFGELHKVPVSILRLSHVYGPGEPVIKPIPQFIDKVLRNQPPVIYGDGEDMRDYIYVDDVVDAIIKAAECHASGIFNISSGQGYTIKEVAKVIIQLSGRKLQPLYKERQKPATKIVLSNRKAIEQLGWRPKTSLQEGLAQHYAYAERIYKKHSVEEEK